MNFECLENELRLDIFQSLSFIVIVWICYYHLLSHWW